MWRSLLTTLLFMVSATCVGAESRPVQFELFDEVCIPLASDRANFEARALANGWADVSGDTHVVVSRLIQNIRARSPDEPLVVYRKELDARQFYALYRPSAGMTSIPACDFFDFDLTIDSLGLDFIRSYKDRASVNNLRLQDRDQSKPITVEYRFLTKKGSPQSARGLEKGLVGLRLSVRLNFSAMPQ